MNEIELKAIANNDHIKPMNLKFEQCKTSEKVRPRMSNYGHG